MSIDQTLPGSLAPEDKANLQAAAGAPEAIVAPPGGTGGPVLWMRKNLFGSLRDSIITVLLGAVLLYVGWGFFKWAVIGATWTAQTADACRANAGGACWAYLVEKAPFMLYGTYPFEERWRPTIVSLLIIAMLVSSCDRRMWNWRLAAMWVVGFAVSWILMFGGVFGLPYVETGLWGGLPVTLILSVVALAAAFPMAILLALGRRSNMPAIKALCVGFIELIRGVPLISLLIMASVMLPLFLPEGVTIDKFLRALVAFSLFAAAYLAEVIRGGLQAIPKGQYEAADALGLSYRLKTQMIILPQALRLVIPPLVNTFIGFFKDTSLVYIIGIYDLLTAGESAVKDPAWRGFANETYLFLAAVYFIFCFSMSRYSQYLERDLNKSHRR
ncbi:MAG: amino acid transporter permease [Alphaproteobacteria bacterium]|jgi:general L-amino acid transport system permease protein|nr:amino acid transporter permease [Alphaproteobacteria bacterium]